MNEILALKAEHWDELAQMLFEFRDTMDSDRTKVRTDLNLTDIEFSFYNIVMAEITRSNGDESIDEATHNEVLALTRELVAMLEEATKIVDFFNKNNEIKAMKKKIKRTIIDTTFDDADMRQAVMDRFMELAKVKFK